MTTATALMQAATTATGGLADFGPDDGFQTSLRIVLADLDTADIPPALRDALLAAWQQRLETRLRLIALRSTHPAIAAQRIAPPLMVTGLPRTGTTYLFDVLARDPGARAPLTWETMTLGKPARPGHWHDDPRIAEIDAHLASLNDPVAGSGLHAYGALLPDECNAIHLYNVWGARYPGEPDAAFLHGANAWAHTCLPDRPYAMHRMILQHLQAHGPAGRWILKDPFHIHALGAFLAEYPGAMIVVTHRNPHAVFASLAGLYATIRGQGPGHPGRPETGRYVLERWGAGLRRMLAARRDPAVADRIVDVGHRQIVGAPLDTVRAIYARFGLALSPDAEARMRGWVANPAQHESKVRFTLADFDLTAADVDAAMGPYADRFGRYF